MSILRKGTRQQVYSGIAKQTAGGLKKKDLFLDGNVIKSKKASKSAKNNSKQLGGARTKKKKKKYKKKQKPKDEALKIRQQKNKKKKKKKKKKKEKEN